MEQFLEELYETNVWNAYEYGHEYANAYAAHANDDANVHDNAYEYYEKCLWNVKGCAIHCTPFNIVLLLS